MASMTTSPPVVTPLAAQVHAPATVLIEPPHGWLDLRPAEVWEYRELLYFFVWRDITIRYKQTVIGVLWVVLQPLLTMGVFTLFFGRLAKLPSEGLPYPVFYFATLVPWAYFSVSLSACTGILVGNQHVITKVYFPRLVLPLAAVCTALMDLVIGFVVMMIITLAYGFRPGPAILLIPLFVVLAQMTALAVGLWTCALNALYRDMAAVVPFVIQFLMLASPVAYSSTLVPPRWRALYHLNPMADVIDGFRWSVTGRGARSGRDDICSGRGSGPGSRWRADVFSVRGGRRCRSRVARPVHCSDIVACHL
jgi:lipopolysaccharide transport system permease protein